MNLSAALIGIGVWVSETGNDQRIFPALPAMMNDHEKRNIAMAIREHMARARMSREAFAFQTKLGKSTVDKLLIGLFSDRTLSIVEETLRVRFRHFEVVEAKADPSLGGYLRSDVSIYEGPYLFIRPSFKEEKTILAFRMSIIWDDEIAGLSLRQEGEADRPQSGVISIPKVSFHLFICSSDLSSTRHLILSRLDADLKMRGLMLTLANTFGNFYVPVSVPVALLKMPDDNDLFIGSLDSNHPMYSSYKEELLLAEQRGFSHQISAAPL